MPPAPSEFGRLKASRKLLVPCNRPVLACHGLSGSAAAAYLPYPRPTWYRSRWRQICVARFTGFKSASESLSPESEYYTTSTRSRIHCTARRTLAASPSLLLLSFTHRSVVSGLAGCSALLCFALHCTPHSFHHTTHSCLACLVFRVSSLFLKPLLAHPAATPSPPDSSLSVLAPTQLQHRTRRPKHSHFIPPSLR